MRVISKRRLREFWQTHADAEQHLLSWWRVAKKAKWKSFDDVRRVYGRAVDRVGACYVFNIRSNHYRLIAVIPDNWAVVLTCIVLTHAEYNTNTWKDTCRC